MTHVPARLALVMLSLATIRCAGEATATSDLASTAAATGTSAVSPTAFHYDATTGKCVDSQGNVGYNTLDADTLFKPSGNENDGGLIHPLYADKNAECVSLANVNFDTALGRTAMLRRWNLRGAVLDGATMHFMSMLDADLSGAHFGTFATGYVQITGTVDTYTQVRSGCSVTGNKVACRH